MNMNQAAYQLGRQMKKITLATINHMVGVIDAAIMNTQYAIRILTGISMAMLRIALCVGLFYGIAKLCTASETEVLAFVANPTPYLQSVAADVLLSVRNGLLGFGEAFKELMSPWTDFINAIMSLR